MMEDVTKMILNSIYGTILKDSGVHNITIRYIGGMTETYLVQFPEDLDKDEIYKMFGKITEWAKERTSVEYLSIDDKVLPKYKETRLKKLLPMIDFKSNYLVTLIHKTGMKVKIAYHCTSTMYFGEVAKLFTDRPLPLGRLDAFNLIDINN